MNWDYGSPVDWRWSPVTPMGLPGVVTAVPAASCRGCKRGKLFCTVIIFVIYTLRIINEQMNFGDDISKMVEELAIFDEEKIESIEFRSVLPGHPAKYAQSNISGCAGIILSPHS
jgi:hypothetical protein